MWAMCYHSTAMYGYEEQIKKGKFQSGSVGQNFFQLSYPKKEWIQVPDFCMKDNGQK